MKILIILIINYILCKNNKNINLMDFNKCFNKKSKIMKKKLMQFSIKIIFL